MIAGLDITGHIKIFEPESNKILVNTHNAIHYENFSEALARSVTNESAGHIHTLHFGNGGTSVDGTGIITYNPTRTSGSTADLYRGTYYKIVDENSTLNIDPARNKMTVRHTEGNVYTDILVECVLDYGEPAGQPAFDNTSNFRGDYVFDELGLKGYEVDDNGNIDVNGDLLTHGIFHPVEKSLNRLIKIEYTIRIQTLTNR